MASQGINGKFIVAGFLACLVFCGGGVLVVREFFTAFGVCGSGSFFGIKSSDPSIPGRPLHPVDDTAKIAELIKSLNSSSDYRALSFATLSNYGYDESDAFQQPPPEQIPKEIKALDGARVAVRGFMVPIEVKNGKSKKFLLVAWDGTQYTTPELNEWIAVNAREDMPVSRESMTIFGTIHVGEVYDGKEVVSIYRMDADGLLVR